MENKINELKKLRQQLNVNDFGDISNRPTLFVCNHNCLMDIFYVPMVIDYDVVSLVSARVCYKNDGDRKTVVDKYLNSFPVEAHGGHFVANTCIKYASDILNNNISEVIFPEGAYVDDDKIFRGRTGASRILFNTYENVHADLVPVAISINSDNLNRDSYYPNSDDVVNISFLPKISYDDYYNHYMDATNFEEVKYYLHKPIDDAMLAIANHLNKEYINEYIELYSKGNVIFSDGSQVGVNLVHSGYYKNKYDEELKLRSKELIKKLS